MTPNESPLAFAASLAPYMAWSKTRPVPAYDLAGSNLLHCEAGDLPAALHTVELTGPNAEGHAALIDAIARRYGTTPDRVATAPGAAGANFLAFAALVRPGDDVLFEHPGYDPIPGALRLLGANVRSFERSFEEGYALDPERIANAWTPRTRLIVLTSPHNPSGALASEDTLRAVGSVAERSGARVLVDEVYLDAVFVDRPPPAANLSDTFISTNSLTKAYGLSGLRSGWILASPEVAAAARRARDVVDGVAPFITDELAVGAFRDLDRLAARARAILEPNAESLARFIKRRPELSWVRPRGGNIAFPRLDGCSDTRPLAERLLREYGTAVVPGVFFGEPAHLRIAFGCAPETLQAGLAALGRALDRASNDNGPHR
jgi:aspartate/methionine/tyrosine aminotransferase